MKHLCRILILSVVAALSFSSVALAQPGSQGKHLGPPGGLIYANNMMFRTIGTPAILPNHGKFDTIYAYDDALGFANVADAAPGDMDFNGGRWEVRPIEFIGGAQPVQYMNADDLKAAAGRGEISIGAVAIRFECPLIPAH